MHGRERWADAVTVAHLDGHRCDSERLCCGHHERGRDDDEIGPQADQFVERTTETFDSSFHPTNIDEDVLARDISELAHAAYKGIHETLAGRRRACLEECGTFGLRFGLGARRD
ncbi:MAG: hypothetical protein ABI702_12840 [Burkholderiales bacterium]